MIPVSEYKKCDGAATSKCSLHLVAIALICFLFPISPASLFLKNILSPSQPASDPPSIERSHHRSRRRLEQSKEGDVTQHKNDDHWSWDVPHLLSRAKSSSSQPLRVLFVTTSLVEYDKGTRGTQHGYDRLQNVVLPPLVDSIQSMTSLGWHVDVYLLLGYGPLRSERREMVERSLPDGVGLEVWEDAIPLFYANTYNKSPREGQSLSMADHALSRQHRFVMRDKLPFYDFFVCFVSYIGRPLLLMSSFDYPHRFY